MRKYIDLARHILFKQKYLHFFLTGISGVALNLGLTWLLTTYVFGLAQYFRAYLIGVSLNLVYNFALHTIVTFNTKERHVQRFVWFVVYSILLTLLQAYVVRTVTPMVGLQYYLLVIATTIFIFSTVTFVFFKYILFRESREVTVGG